MSELSGAARDAADTSTMRWVTGDVRRVLVAQLLFGFGWSIFLLLPKYYTTVLHVGPEHLGRISSTGGVVGLLAAPLAGYALDRLGRVTFFRVGCALLLLLALGFLQVREAGLAVYLLQALVTSAFVLSFNSTAALITDHAPAEQMGRAIGWLGGVNVAMNAVATVVAEPLAERFGWSSVFILAAVTAVAALAFSLSLRECGGSMAAVQGATTGAAPAVGSIVVVLSVTVLNGACFIAVFSFIQPYVLDLGGKEIRYFLIGFSAAAVLCRVLMGGLGDRFGRSLVSGAALCGYGLCAYFMVSLDTSRLLLYGLLFGAAHGVLYPTLNALVASIMPVSRRGLAMVLYNAAFNLGMIVGAFGWGRLAERRGYPSMYELVAWVAGVAAAFLWWRRPERLAASE